jgi:predicted secreted protein
MLRIGTLGALDVTLINEEAVSHLMLCEQQLRVSLEVQNAYPDMRSMNVILEDQLQMYILYLHGVENATTKELETYRSVVSNFTHIPTIRQNAFFLRNNVRVVGAQCGTVVPRDIPLYNLEFESSTYVRADSSSSTDINQLSSICLGDCIDHAQKLNKQLIILAGSLT